MESRPQLSPIWRPYAEAARALGARLTRDALRPGRSGNRLDGLARRLHGELDRMVQQAFDSLPDAGELACTAGCDICCRTLPVGVSPIETFTIVRRLRDTLDTSTDLCERLMALEGLCPRMTSPASPHEAAAPRPAPVPHSLPPCPLLGSDGLCTVYSSRPLACRGCVSADASACAACDEKRPVPRSTAHQLGAAAMMRGVCDTLDTLGLFGRPVDIRAALLLAYRDEDAEKRWLHGEDVFAGLS